MSDYTPQSSLLSPGRIGQARWAEELVKRLNRDGVEVIAYFYHAECEECGINPDLALAQAAEECAWFTSRRWLDQWNPCGLGITSDDVPGHVFHSMREGIEAHVNHICCYAYSAANCPVNHEFTPDFRHTFHDGRPALSHLQEPKPGRRWAEKPGYVGRILAIANRLLPEETNMPPKPIVISKPSPNRGGYQHAHDPQAVVWHVTVGGFAGSLSWLTNPKSGASANYLINKDGAIYELVPPNESAWANGAVNKPDMTNPLIAAWVTKPVNPNARTVSIEMVRESSALGNPGGFTEAQHQSLVALTAWLCGSFGMAPDRTHIIRHAQIDSVNRKNCPGLAESEMLAWIGEVAAIVSGVKPPSTEDPGFPGALQPNGATKLNDTDFGGEAVSVEEVVVKVRNAAGERYQRRWVGHQLDSWERI